MNACHQNMYKGKQKLIDMDVQISLQEIPKVTEFTKALPEFPTYKMEHILINKDDEETKDETDSMIQLQSIDINQTISDPKSPPRCIVNDWLFIGDHAHCKSLKTIKKIGITHILCCSDIIPTYFLHSDDEITYARIPVVDINYSNIYDYFYAAKQFIDSCNPLICNKDKKGSNNIQNKILIHCEMGISRSATIIIAYLISNKIKLNDDERYRFDVIQMYLDKFEREHHNYYKVKKPQDDDIVFMKLNEAYYYVQSCRGKMEPNLGFCKQLEKWEKIFHGKRSTLQDLPKYTLAIKENDTKLGKTVARIQATKEICNCVIL